MKFFLALALLAVMTGTVMAGGYTDATGRIVASPASKVIENQWIVTFAGNATDAAVSKHMEAVAALSFSEVLHEYHITDGMKTFFRGYAARMSEADLRVLASRPEVAATEADRTVHKQQHACTTQTDASWGMVRTNERDFDDHGRYHYHVDAFDAQRIYIVDTGIYVDNVGFDGLAELGPSFVPGEKTSVDEQGHGTHVASLAASAPFGLAKGATTVAVKVLGADGSGSTSGVIAGVDWSVADAVERHDDDPTLPTFVMNLSLGGGYSSALNSAVDAAVAANVVTIVAAGNEDQNACNTSPAAAADVIAVAASDSEDQRSYFSNWGSCVDIVAPGSDIIGLWIGKSAAATISGTSMASPFVAGVAAKYAALHPEASAYDVHAAILSAATTGALSDLKGTPDLLLFGDCD